MNWRENFNQVKKFILDWLFPIECLGCGQENIWLCDNCFKKIKLRIKDDCPVCKESSTCGATHDWCEKETRLDGLVVAANFNDQLLQEAIHKFKYNFARELAVPLAQILIEKIKQLDAKEDKPNPLRLLLGYDISPAWTGVGHGSTNQEINLEKKLIVAPVPLHPRRLNWRGFNQAEKLGRRLARAFNLNLETRVLKRIRHTQPQTKLKREQRLKNIKGAFRVNQEWQDQLKSTKVLLVDDVTTTTATLNECARVLKQAGVIEVWGIILARG